MNRNSIRRHRLAASALVIALGAIGFSFSGEAVAGCGLYNPSDMPAPSRPTAPLPTAAGMLSAVYRPGLEQFIKVDDDHDARGSAGIVGTWRFTFVSDGTAYPVPIPYGAMVDFGTAQWHSDGTEFLISGGRPPSSGDVCMGTWEQTGPSTYRLKHIALAWASSDSTPPATPAVFVGPAIIRETVTLSHSRNSYEGNFTIDQYARDEVTLLEHVSGKVTATRFTLH